MKTNVKVDVDELKQKSEGFINEFKAFVMRGNVMDMAVGVIIGSAFNAIVTSLVNDIFMPFIGIIIGGIDFTSLTLKLGDAAIKYGIFLQNIINFLATAFCLFIFVKFMNRLHDIKESKEKKDAKDVKVEAPKKSDEVLLLEEIRDLLKKES